MAMERLTMKFDGVSPLLMHSARGADPLDPLTREMKKLSGNRKKTDEIHALMSRTEWELGLYFDSEMGVYLPTTNMRACIIEGAKKSKQGQMVMSGTMVETDRSPLIYKGPKTIEGMWEAGTFRDARSVVVGQARVMRTRPIFRQWSVTFTMLLDTQVIQRDQLLAAAQTAGTLIGLGDYRPPCGGAFGRFSVSEVAS